MGLFDALSPDSTINSGNGEAASNVVCITISCAVIAVVSCSSTLGAGYALFTLDENSALALGTEAKSRSLAQSGVGLLWLPLMWVTKASFSVRPSLISRCWGRPWKGHVKNLRVSVHPQCRGSDHETARTLLPHGSSMIGSLWRGVDCGGS